MNRPAPWFDRKQPNSLNLFRLILAGAVVYAHAFNLAGFKDPLEVATGYGLGTLAVNCFFSISGFLIVGSWLSCPLDRYLRNRIARIWPGFMIAALFSFVMAAICSPPDFLHSFHYLSAVSDTPLLNAAWMNTRSAFPSNPYPYVVNGSLWTIPIEFGCYIAVALAGSIGVFRYRPNLIWFTLFSVLVMVFLAIRSPVQLLYHWSRFASYFAAGGAFYLYRERIPYSLSLAFLSGVLSLASIFHPLFQHVFPPLCGTYLIFFLAYSAPSLLKKIGSKNDISYGVYLYAFPLQQACYYMAKKGWLPLSPTINACLAGLLTIACAWGSWKIIEEPCMHYFRRITPMQEADKPTSKKRAFADPIPTI